MALFDIKCEVHGVQEVFGKDSKNLKCPECGKTVPMVWSRPATFRMDFRSGWDMGAGQNFYSKRDRENWISTSHSRRIRD